jgi:hypothetical protein
MKTVLLLAAAVVAQEKPALFSGPQKGEALPAFKVVDVTGPNAGKEVDYVAEFKGAPTVLVFVHEVTRPGGRVVRDLDRIARDRADLGLKALVVFLGADPFEREKYVPLYQRSLGTAVPLAVSVDGAEGPGAYGLNKQAELTILVARENRVLYNAALVDPNETVTAAVEREIDAALPPPPALSPEEAGRELRRLRIEVRRLRRELDELRQQQLNAQRMEPRRGDR